MKGIVLIALKNSYYAQAAYNLVLSIKFHMPDIPIALVYHGNSIDFLNESQRINFSHLIEADPKMFLRKGNEEPIKSKTFLYELSPFDQTLYLDCDMILSPTNSIAKIFDQLNGTQLQFAVRSEVKEGNGISDWVDLKAVYKNYRIDHWYDLSSEFIYFEKSKEVKKVFKDAQKFYDDDKLITKKFAGGKPDEPAFAISIEQNKIKQICPFKPIHWVHSSDKKFLNKNEIFSNYFGLSMGGSWQPEHIKKMYRETTEFYRYKMKAKYVFALDDKRKTLKERALI